MANHSLKRLRINLASLPLRNRNLYFALLGLLAVLILAAAVGGGLIYFRYHGRNVASQASLQDLELATQTAQTETAFFAAKSQEASRGQKARVDFANEAVYFKSFSWTRFLSELEGSLTGASHIIALAPTPMGKSRVEVRLRVVSASLDEMLAFVKNLKAPSFANIRIIGDEQKGGEVVSEVSLTYEEHR